MTNSTTGMSQYDFRSGLAKAQMLEVLAYDPVFSALAADEALIPPLGGRTRPSVTNAKGMLLFGAATVLFGSDRSAEAEVRYLWPQLAPVLRRAGIAVSAQPPKASAWRYYRERYLRENVEQIMEALRGLWVGQAETMGLFPEPTSHYDWLHPAHLHTVYADGTWLAPASRTNVRGQPTRATKGKPRISEGIVLGGKLDGYCWVMLVARRPEPRMRVILDFTSAPAGGEIPVALDALLRLRSKVGDRLRQFVYDRALRGHDHWGKVMSAGILPIGKPDGVDAFGDWDVRGEPLRGGVLTFRYDFDGCSHQLAADYGMLWHLEHDGKSWIYTKRADVEAVQRIQTPQGSYSFELTLRLLCDQDWHRLHVNLIEPLVVDGGKREVRLTGHLKVHQMADAERFAHSYGPRNDIESTFSYLKNHLGLGPRAGSFSATDHMIDVILTVLISNALTWAEWKQTNSTESAAC